MPIKSGGGSIIRGGQNLKKLRINKRSNGLQGSKKSVTLYSLIVDDTINDMDLYIAYKNKSGQSFKKSLTTADGTMKGHIIQ